MINSITSNFSASSQISSAQRAADSSAASISSGRSINSAKDDAAGLAISDGMNSQVRGLNQAMRNANDGISMAQTADGALGESTDILQRMREIAVQASNFTYNASDRQSLNSEFSQLQSELDRIGGSTAFNGQNLLDGSLESGASFQVGANSGESTSVSINGATQEHLGTASLNVLTGDNAQAALEAIDGALEAVSGTRGELGATINGFESTISNLSNTSENIAAAESRIGDADIAAESSNMIKNKILEQAGVAMQVQANTQAGTLLALLQ